MHLNRSFLESVSKIIRRNQLNLVVLAALIGTVGLSFKDLVFGQQTNITNQVVYCDERVTQTVGTMRFDAFLTVAENNGILKSATALLITGGTATSAVFNSAESTYDVGSASPPNSVIQPGSISWTNINSTNFIANADILRDAQVVTTFFSIETAGLGRVEMPIWCDLDGAVPPTTTVPTIFPTPAQTSTPGAYPGPPTPTIVYPTRKPGSNEQMVPLIVQQ